MTWWAKLLRPVAWSAAVYVAVAAVALGASALTLWGQALPASTLWRLNWRAVQAVAFVGMVVSTSVAWQGSYGWIAAKPVKWRSLAFACAVSAFTLWFGACAIGAAEAKMPRDSGTIEAGR